MKYDSINPISKLSLISITRLTRNLDYLESSHLNQSLAYVTEYFPITQLEVYKMFLDFELSRKKALAAEYKEVHDPKGFNGVYFIDNRGKKWIHHAEKLARKMNVVNLEELEKVDYNLNDFFKYKDLDENGVIKQVCRDELIDIFGHNEEMTYLNDGMWLTPEGDIVHR